MGHTTSSVASSCLLAALAALAPAHAAGDPDLLAPIVVTATLRATPLEQLPASVTVLDAATLAANAQQHFEEVLPLVPNLNWAGDTSRPRYFQIRGIGELQQYQGAPNPSVGFLIDDIDFSGLGSAATLFDVDRVEVLRGPQGSVYGANALAGLIYVKSAEPEPRFAARAELEAGNFGERSYGAVVTGPVEALDSSFRLAVQRYTADGYYRNAYLGRDDTDARDELTLRGRWRLQPTQAWRLDVSVLRAAMNNGYDAFAIDNSRTTQSDHPSADRQFSTGVSARSTLDLAPYTFTTIATYADSSIHYGFDGDWGNARLWAPYTYDYTDEQARHRSTRSLELRLARSGSALAWVIGLYGFELQEALSERSAGTYVDPFDAAASGDTLTLTDSHFTARSGALYAQLDGHVTPRLRWSAALRGERHVSRYADQTSDLDAPDAANHFAPADNLWGGNASLDFTLVPGQTVYALVSRGYKASGFNLSAGLPAEQRRFAPEWDLNLELGYKALLAGGRLRTESALFYMARHHEQLLTGEQLDPSDPNTFIYFTGNARAGFNYGLESSATFAPDTRFEFSGSLGLLQTRYQGFVQNGTVLPDRALPHAPAWQAALGGTWHEPRGAYVHLELTGMGAFFYDLPPNDTRSHAYGLLNGKLGWQGRHLEVYLWGRNLLDKGYTVRGFYFGDEPPDFDSKLYTQLGEPRSGGVHVTARY